ncbi:LysM peptidoglycan-binding domain-containing protein [Paenibacillus sp. GCM10012307]|uniref:LysM peptidoglycan-binding domain-containing protein n=1 Tax=Paenibacillus roseus TaxID=2798579 RepID=A0A934MPH6_9BACL|nr:LysM peptidoglycan-binding domain-containing protein [Paenibacillus roseus]MBJ6360429.1 LysM peptidoglycan-binding domain-containing protein [Paenibacillus roseus]
MFLSSGIEQTAVAKSEDGENKEPLYRFTLSHNNGAESFDFPVLPESIEVQKKGRGQTYDILGIGEINIIQSGELAEISFEGVFPARRVHYLSINKDKWKSPSYYIQKINQWQASGHPSRLSVKTETLDFTMAVSIEQFDRREAAGEGGDIAFKLSFKEYKFYMARRVIVDTNTQGETKVSKDTPARPDERVPPKTYALKKNDSLWSVAQSQLGDGSGWKEIMELNKISYDKVTKLPIGLVLRLPERRKK